jgi:hypothetical protein
MIDTMSSTPKWTLKVWRGLIERQLSGWMMYIPGVRNSNEVKTLKVFTGAAVVVGNRVDITT